jgi:anti-sigma B factor antagonist
MSRTVFKLHNVVSDRPSAASAEVAVTGEIDVTNAEEFSQSVLALDGRWPIILQLSGLGYLDSAGFAALDRLLALRVIVVVLSPESVVHKAAELMELPFHHDTETARRVLQQQG